MAYSMTGYARVRSENDELSMVLTLRSVNHRFADLQLRIPGELEALEARIRRLVKQHVKRGQVQISISIDWNGLTESVTVNQPLIEAYLGAYRELARRHGIPAEPDLNVLLRLPDAVSFNGSELDEPRRALLERTLDDGLTRGLEELNRARQQEGAGIVDEMKDRLRRMREDVEALESVRLDTVPKFQERLEKRLGELLERFAPEPQRVLQEAAILADRADISEELQRFGGHLERLTEMLDGGGELGKKIDFLSQEMNRETNTILSKSTPLGRDGLAVTEVGVRLKAEIEKIREQAQNLE